MRSRGSPAHEALHVVHRCGHLGGAGTPMSPTLGDGLKKLPKGNGDASENREGNGAKKEALPQAFQKGVSGNPGGRPKHRLERQVRERCNGGSDLVDWWFHVWRGEPIPMKVIKLR